MKKFSVDFKIPCSTNFDKKNQTFVMEWRQYLEFLPFPGLSFQRYLWQDSITVETVTYNPDTDSFTCVTKLKEYSGYTKDDIFQAIFPHFWGASA